MSATPTRPGELAFPRVDLAIPGTMIVDGIAAVLGRARCIPWARRDVPEREPDRCEAPKR
jgi:hypothetical protein